METAGILQSEKFANVPSSLASQTQSLEAHGMFAKPSSMHWGPINSNSNRAMFEIPDSKAWETESRNTNMSRKDTETANEGPQEFSHAPKRLRSEGLLLSSGAKQESSLPCVDSFGMAQSLRKEVQPLISPKNGNSFWHSAKNNSWVSSQLPSPHSYNPLDEPSPLGLRLRKSPSLLELISMSVAQNSSSSRLGVAPSSDTMEGFFKTKDALNLTQDKLKASNFPATVLKIGSWECYSRYEGDLVAKCYYAKRKLVWEVLENGLKSKIEVQWSDITSLKASCLENESGSLEIEVSRPPLFYRELNPQPRKHTLWQTTSDFTGGEATISRHHYLQFPEGVLNKHYEKLLQCDPRLKVLARDVTASRGEFSSSNQYEKQEISCQLFKCEATEALLHNAKQDQSDFSRSASRTPNEKISSAAKFTSKLEFVVQSSIQSPSPNSAIDTRGVEETGSTNGGFCVKDESSSILRSEGTDFVPSHVAQDNMEDESLSSSIRLTGENTNLLERNVLNEIAQVLLGESLLSIASHEEAFALATKVHAFSASLAQDVQYSTPLPTHESLAVNSFPVHTPAMYFPGRWELEAHHCEREEEMEDMKPHKERNIKWELNSIVENNLDALKPWLTKNNSAVDLLVNLPRITSLPEFFDPLTQRPF